VLPAELRNSAGGASEHQPGITEHHQPAQFGRDAERAKLRSDALRPEGWTSADAAGLPILPLLVRYSEVRAGQIDHALRVTVPSTQRGYIHPATHFASSSEDPNLPPMGLRLRLKATFSLAPFHGEALVVLEALKRYGLIVADTTDAAQAMQALHSTDLAESVS